MLFFNSTSSFVTSVRFSPFIASIFENVVSGNLKSFFQSGQVDISLYFTETIALHHLRKLASLKLSSYTFNLIGHLAQTFVNAFMCLSTHVNILFCFMKKIVHFAILQFSRCNIFQP